MVDFNYVIVGAGTAGCALASRLSEDPADRSRQPGRGVAARPGRRRHPGPRWRSPGSPPASFSKAH